jgi:hypothetical protein
MIINKSKQNVTVRDIPVINTSPMLNIKFVAGAASRYGSATLFFI